MEIYADLHIHVGRTQRGEPVKISASPQLTIPNIFKAAQRKGLDLIGIVDAAAQGVLADLQELRKGKQLVPVRGGGYLWGEITLFLGSEVEIRHGPKGRAAHFLAFFPTYEALANYAQSLKPHLANPSLSTQRLRICGDTWLEIVEKNGGIALAAHAFTPHKGVYGNCVSRLKEMFAHPKKIKGLELGLSADAKMAEGIGDTRAYAYLSSSDAHSLQSIAREFTVYDLPRLNFAAWTQALKDRGRGILATHGLEPRLGKYFRSFCPRCQWLASAAKPTFICPLCQGPLVHGVWDRVQEIKDRRENSASRPPYIAHVPLMMLPGVGPKTYEKMLQNLGSEIDILYKVPLAAIGDLVGWPLASQIKQMREGRLAIVAGGGGKYGRVAKTLVR